MLIGIDGNEANTTKRVGIGQFAYQVLHELYRQNITNQYHIYLSSPPLADLPRPSTSWQYRVFGPARFWTQWRLPLDLYFAKVKPDVFFSPSHYSPRFSPVPTVCSVMDLGYLKYPTQFTKKDLLQLTHWTRYSLKQASKIITISKFTKHEILAHYSVPEAKIVVAPLAPSPAPKQPLGSAKQVLAKFGISSPYFLYLGTLKPTKNIPHLIHSFALFLKRQSNKAPNYQLVIAGKKGWLFQEIFAVVQTLHLTKQVLFTDFVSEEEKYCLLANAQALVVPSLYEGFGIPVLEAMQAGTPVIASNISSLPEIVGNAGLLVDPTNTQELALALQSLTSPNTRKQYIKLGFLQAKHFSWSKTASIILSTLHSAARTS